MATENNEAVFPITSSLDYWGQKTLDEIKKRTYVDPLYDPGFKAFLGDEKALVSFLNGVFHLKDDRKITSVTIKNPEINIIFPETKNFKLDIRATTANGICINVEMQKARPPHFADRIVLQNSAFTLLSKYEWNQSLGELPPNPTDKERAEREARRYEIPPVYTIWICDFKVARQDSYRGNWTIRNEKGLTLNDKVMYIIYDLTQFNKPLEEIKTNEDRWLYLLKHAGKAESLPDFGDDIIAKAIRRILVKAAPEKLLKEQADDMVLTEEQLDHLAWLKVNAENKLRAEGRAEGITEGANCKARETAAKMLAKDKPVDEIAEFTGLSESEILAIKAGTAQ